MRSMRLCSDAWRQCEGACEMRRRSGHRGISRAPGEILRTSRCMVLPVAFLLDGTPSLRICPRALSRLRLRPDVDIRHLPFPRGKPCVTKSCGIRPGTCFSCPRWKPANCGLAWVKRRGTGRSPRRRSPSRHVPAEPWQASPASRFDDTFESLIDPATLCTYTVTKRVREGKSERDIDVTYYPEDRRLHILETDVAKSPPHVNKDKFVEDIPSCVHDVFAAVYALRRTDLHVGSRDQWVLGDDDNIKKVETRVVKSEIIQGHAGPVRSLPYRNRRVAGRAFQGGWPVQDLAERGRTQVAGEVRNPGEARESHTAGWSR